MRKFLTGNGKIGVLFVLFAMVISGSAQVKLRQAMDTDGDGKADFSIFRAATNTWYIRNLSATVFGGNGDTPVPADYDGDGKTDIGVYRPSTGMWYIINSSTGLVTQVQWGGN